ncbi:MAG: cytochrome-c peroxidase [Saprospiraceae bacterium]|nr:cytochrome-c peroxidase [Saprospiraceae bacterium]
MNTFNKIFCLLFAVLLFASCKKDDPVVVPEDVKFTVPSNFPAPTYSFSSNEITQSGFELGRRLFYDPIFSRDSSISCGDCHISYSAFSHVDHITSHGINGLLGKRNAPAVQNMAWRTSFFWDGGVPLLDLVPLNAIQNPVEMDEVPANVVRKLNRSSVYPAMFKKAFPGLDTISGADMLKALSQFMNMLVSANSRYDHYVRGESGGTLSADELAGLALFKAKCSTCHATDLFTDQSFRNNGILSDFTLDKCRYEVSTFPDDIGKFAVPSLRNVERTPPYMHNGKFKTLEAVLNHYTSGVKDTPSLDPLLKQNGQLGIPLTDIEKQQIIAFLKTLTDESFSTDPRFQHP